MRYIAMLNLLLRWQCYSWWKRFV